MLSDLRLALRQLVKSPGQACAILLILARGIGGMDRTRCAFETNC